MIRNLVHWFESQEKTRLFAKDGYKVICLGAGPIRRVEHIWAKACMFYYRKNREAALKAWEAQK